jgi:hypothetical protein
MDISGDILDRLFSRQAIWIALWVGLAVFTCVLIALVNTRLGRSKPLQKCSILAVWFHLLLLIYATSIQVVPERLGGGNQVTISLSAGDDDGPTSKRAAPDAKPVVRELPRSLGSSGAKLLPPTAPVPKIETKTALAPRPTFTSAPKPSASDVAVPTPVVPPTAAKPPAMSPAVLDVPRPNTTAKLADTAPRVAKLDVPKPAAPQSKEMTPVDATPSAAAKSQAGHDVAPATVKVAPPMVPIVQPSAAPAKATPPIATAAVPDALRRPVELEYRPPQLYQERLAADKTKIAAAHGGSEKTEAAVKLALKWLAAHQEPDGRWNPRRFGAGQESETLGHNRGGAGAKADTGITGLALLAMLGAGHTHERGDYKPTVAGALQFLVDAQHPNGNLGGEAEPFAFMYCHGMATLAISEALAITGDERLKDPVRRAIGYSIAAQNRVTGGWRYRPQEGGDLSQLGWQLMALKSAELGGIEIPKETRDGMTRFLQSVSSGNHGGLGSYRAGERVSHPMTAEALLCKQFLGMSRKNPASDEAGDYLLGELPGKAQPNYYYWYYGTLSMYQLQGPHWQKWNEALATQLVRTQVDRGEDAGTWEPNDIWGSYGGTVYSTALATLCLEVYYRYLPLYVEAAANGGDTLRK